MSIIGVQSISRHTHLSFFFFNDTATTEIYTLSLHDALPISQGARRRRRAHQLVEAVERALQVVVEGRLAVGHAHAGVQRGVDRKSTRLNSSHQIISYAVFCLKKKKTKRSCLA